MHATLISAELDPSLNVLKYCTLEIFYIVNIVSLGNET